MESVRVEGRAAGRRGRWRYFYGYTVGNSRVNLFVDAGRWGRAFYECRRVWKGTDVSEDTGFVVDGGAEMQRHGPRHSLRKHMKGAGRARRSPAVNLDLESSGSEEWGVFGRG